MILAEKEKARFPIWKSGLFLKICLRCLCGGFAAFFAFVIGGFFFRLGSSGGSIFIKLRGSGGGILFRLRVGGLRLIIQYGCFV